jgi:hypothetical protein
MKRPVRRCINCGTALKPAVIRPTGAFPCPVCNTQLQAPSSYANRIAMLNVVISVAASYALGFRGLYLLFAVVLAWWFLEFLIVNLGRYIVPPKVEIAVPPKTISQIFRERNQRTELKLNDKKRP